MPRLDPASTARRTAGTAGANFVEALARGLEVIRAFGRERTPMTLSEVARRTGLAKPTVRRMLLTLCETGYFESDGNTFRPSPNVLSLAMSYLGSDLVTTVLQPACERLMAQTDEASFVAIRDGQQIVMIANANRSFTTGLVPSIGLRLPILATAAGRAILGALPDAELERVFEEIGRAKVTPLSEADRSRLRKIVARSRVDGIATSVNEAVPGYCAVAAPLRRVDGGLLGALSISTRVERHRAEPRWMDELGVLLRREAAALSSLLV